MSSVYRARLAGLYVFSEMLPSFALGNVIFIFILLMFQVLRLSEFIIIHGVSFKTMLELTTYMTISFLPVCIPISLLFSILLTFGRLSSDSEIVAFKSSGLHLGHLLVPAMVLATIVAIVSGYVIFYAGPWGNRGFEVLFTKLANSKAVTAIREGTFAEGFYDLVLYADKVDSKKGELKKVFIYDERNSDSPLTVIASEGRMVEADPNNPGSGMMLRLIRGNIHNTKDTTYTKVNFQLYDIGLANTAVNNERDKSPQSFTLTDIVEGRRNPNLPEDKKRVMDLEFHKRWALVFACIVFGALGVGAGTVTNRRTVKASGFIVSLLIMVSYWVLYITGDNLSRNGTLPPFVAMWIANFIFAGISIWSLRRSW